MVDDVFKSSRPYDLPHTRSDFLVTLLGWIGGNTEYTRIEQMRWITFSTGPYDLPQSDFLATLLGWILS